MEISVLIVDDDPHIGTTLQHLFAQKNVPCLYTPSLNEAREALKTNRFSVALIDLVLGDENGLKFVEEFQSAFPLASVIIITGRDDVQSAQQAIRLKVFDYITKPFRLNTIWQVVSNAHKNHEVRVQREILEREKEEYAQKLEREVAAKTEEIHKTAQFYKKLAYDIPFGIMSVVDDQVIFINRAALDIIGRETYEGNVHDLIDSAKKKSFKRVLDETVKCRKTLSLRFRVKKYGEEVRPPVFASFLPTNFDDESGAIIAFNDQTTIMESRVKEMRYRSEYFKEYHLSLIGQLASGIAHNLNTPLSIIQGNAELLSIKFPDLTETQMILRQTEHMGRQISNLIKKGKNELVREEEEIDLNELIRDEVEFSKSNLYFKHYIETTLDLADRLPLVRGVFYDFSVCLSAVIQNAVDAMYNCDTRKLHIRTTSDREWVTLSISDTGMGMSPEIKEKIFDPFFTTKAHFDDMKADSKLPRGNGLGLSMVKDVVEHYGLQLQVDSRPRAGTTFTIKFPRISRAT